MREQTFRERDLRVASAKRDGSPRSSFGLVPPRAEPAARVCRLKHLGSPRGELAIPCFSLGAEEHKGRRGLPEDLGRKREVDADAPSTKRNT